jgi:hypothetical protein
LILSWYLFSLSLIFKEIIGRILHTKLVVFPLIDSVMTAVTYTQVGFPLIDSVMTAGFRSINIG